MLYDFIVNLTRSRITMETHLWVCPLVPESVSEKGRLIQNLGGSHLMAQDPGLNKSRQVFAAAAFSSFFFLTLYMM